MKNVLIIGAHYDDAELGAGGTMAKLVDNGCNVYKITLTDNEVQESMYNRKTCHSSSAIESSKASDILGVKEIEMAKQGLTCQLRYSTEMMQEVEKIILDYGIDTIFMHSEMDTNQDHAEAGKISKTAARHCDNLLIYQSNLYVCSQPYYPTVFFDISNYIEKKQGALKQYGVEHHRFTTDDNSLFESNISRNRAWGYANGVMYAEGFMIYKMVF